MTTSTRSADKTIDERLGKGSPPALARPHLLALHCSGSGAHQWKSWRAAAQGRVDIVAPALLGYDSTVRWDAAHRIELSDEVDRLAPLLAEAAGGVHLVGHSYGGAVALELAMNYPAEVRSLTLYEPVRFSVLREFGDLEWAEIAAVAQRVLGLVQSGSMASSSQHFVDYWSGPGTWARLPSPARATTCLRITKICAEFDALSSDRTPLEAYCRLTMPVHLLSGTHSPAPARRVVDRLMQLIPGARHTRMAGLGHMGPATDPARVLDATGLLDDPAR